MEGPLLVLISVIIMLVGIAGTILPFLPGLPLVWAGTLLFFIFSGREAMDIAFFSAITVIAIIGTVLAFVLPGQRGYAAGAAWSSVILGFVGAVIGAFVLPVFGAIPGGVLGVYVGERLRHAGHDMAWQATIATLKGMGWAFLCQFTASVAIFAVFTPWAVLSA